LRIPTLPKLRRISFGVSGTGENHAESYADISPNLFPNLQEVHLKSVFKSIEAFGKESFPSVRTLDLSHIIYISDNSGQSFPNLKALKVGPTVTWYDLEKILREFVDVHHLKITFDEEVGECRGWLWKAVTGGAKLRQRECLTVKDVVDIETGRILGGPRPDSRFLGHFYSIITYTFFRKMGHGHYRKS